MTLPSRERGVIPGKGPETELELILETHKLWIESQQKRDEMYERRNNALVEVIAELTMVISKLNDGNIAHHTEMSVAIQAMRDRTTDLVSLVRTATRPIPKK